MYDPATNSWTSGPTLNQQRSFPAGTHVGNTAVAVGGYTGSSTTTSVEINVTGGGCASPTPTVPPSATPTGSPTCTPGGTPGPWSTASPYPITDVRYGFAQTATHFYVFGGVSNGTRVPDVNRLVLATGMWESRAPMPFTSEAPTCALMASTGIVYCTEGDTGSGFASYNIATNTWTPLASIPGGDHYGSASGAFNGKVFVAGGTTGFVSAVQVYDVATNTWSAGTAAPNDFLLAGYQQVGQFLYVVGGFEASGPVAKVSAELSSVLNRGQQSKQPKVPMANNTTTWRLDMSSAPGVWTVGPAFTAGRADFGLAYDAGTNKLYALGGDSPGGGFFDSTNAVDELSVASWPAGSWMPSPPNLILPNRQANQAGFYGSGQIWSVGGLVGQTFQFLAEVQRRSNGSGPCGTPTATPTATPTFTPTATPTGTPSATPTCPPGNQYTIAQIGGSIVPGTTDIGNHGDDTVTTIALPFSYTLYDQTFTSINLSSNGNAQFTTTDTTFSNVCLPWAAHNYSIYPYWDDLYLVNSGFGIFTSISGTAPNRIFNIEWRAQYFPGSGTAGFELRLYEGQTRFDVIYGTLTNGNTSATAGVQKDDTTFTQYFCNGTGGAATGGQSYTLQGCGTPTPTPTATATASGTPSATPTCPPGGSPGPWTQAAPVAIDHYGGFMDSDGTFAYEGGGYSFTTSENINEFGKFNPATNTWTPLAPVPDLANAEASGVYAPNVNKLFVFGGEDIDNGHGGQHDAHLRHRHQHLEYWSADA